MKSIINFAAKTFGIGTLATLATVSAAASASAFSFTTDRANCTAGVGCVSTVTGAEVRGTLDFDSPVGGPYTNPLISNSIGATNLANDTTENVAAAPFEDRTQYLVVGKGGVDPIPASYTLNFVPDDLVYFGMYWGSIDAENSLEFWSGADGTGTLLGTIFGSQASNPDPAVGNQIGEFDNRYLNVITAVPYKSVVFKTDKIAFEADNVTAAVPEPTTMAGLAVAGGVGAFLKRRQKRQATQA